MGNTESDLSNNEFINESMRENFVLSIIQCRVEGPIKFSKEIIEKRKNTQHFIIVAKGHKEPAKIWHSSNILVVCMILDELPLNLYECSYYKYHEQINLAICVDQAAYYHI